MSTSSPAADTERCTSASPIIVERGWSSIAPDAARNSSGNTTYIASSMWEEFASPLEAIAREKQLKNWPRDWKIQLIDENNLD
jgi:hypothetical protein